MSGENESSLVITAGGEFGHSWSGRCPMLPGRLPLALSSA